MRQELDFNDPYIAGHRGERLSRLNESPGEHTYLHATLDEAVADQQRHTHPIIWAMLLQLVILSIAVIWLALR